ncbi:MAG TPA: hypothetical protein VF875_06000 [Anaeromyxobacter sp.]
MTDDRLDPAEAPAPRRTVASLLARNPVFAIIALLLCGWLLVDLWPDVSYFLSSVEPIDLGGPGAYHLDLARENRLAQIRGELAQALPVTEARTGAPRTVGRLAGTNLVVDRPGRGGPPVFEGRLLPARSNPDYSEAVALMRQKGAQLGDRWLVLRDGDRPRKRWLPVLGSAILLALSLVNLRALVKALAS